MRLYKFDAIPLPETAMAPANRTGIGSRISASLDHLFSGRIHPFGFRPFQVLHYLFYGPKNHTAVQLSILWSYPRLLEKPVLPAASIEHAL